MSAGRATTIAPKRRDRKGPTLLAFAITVPACILVGVFLSAIGVGPMSKTIPISLSIGLVSVGVSEALSAFLLQRRLFVYFAGIPFGALAGLAVHGYWLNPGEEWAPRALWSVIGGSFVFGGAVALSLYLHDRKRDLEQELHAAELRKLEAEALGLEAQLKMLQAQIEPHFLFNTLANVTALIGSDAATARRLLERLIAYLRATLARTRATGGTLADEIELLRAYLEIHRIRMGERLHYTFDVPAPLASQAFPPMLLQPLVENALKHGLEPKMEGGELRISAANTDGRLRVRVRDNGVGFGETASGGTGVRNVRERLAALYGAGARLELQENAEGGVTVELELPA